MNRKPGPTLQTRPQAIGLILARQTVFGRMSQPVFTHGKNNVKLPEAFRSFFMVVSHLSLMRRNRNLWDLPLTDHHEGHEEQEENAK
jgi:hypothetical protein